MQQISEQIFTEVYSSSIRNIEEKDDITIRNKYAEEIAIFSRAQLSNIEFYKDKTTDGVYWTLHRLDKNNYERQKNEKIKSIKEAYKAGTYLDDDVAKLHHFIPAYENSLKVPGDAMFYEDKNLKIEIEYQIKSILQGFSITHIPSSLSGKVDMPIADSLEVWVKTSNKTKGVVGLPIRFNYVFGNGLLEKDIAQTGRTGRVTNKVLKVYSREKLQTLRAFIDLSYFRDGSSIEDPYILKKLEKLQEIKDAKFVFNIAEVFELIALL